MSILKSKVSVIITVYNGLPFLSNAIDALLMQEYSDFELIILNDGSSDGTEKLLFKYSSNENVTIINSKRIGRAKALNLAIERSEGAYIAINDCDDISEPNRLSIQVSFLDKNKEYVLIGSRIKLIDLSNNSILDDLDSKRPLFDEQIRNYFYKGQPIEHSSVMFRKSAYDKVRGYNEKNDFLIDRDFFLRISKIGKLRNLDMILVNKGLSNSQFFKTTYTGLRRILMDFKYRLYASYIYKSSLKIKFMILALLVWSLIPNYIRVKIKKII